MSTNVITIDKKSPAKYQLASFFRTSIEMGKYKVGDRLPSTRELVEATGVSSNTVRVALEELEREGLLKTIHGSGTYVLDKSRQISWQKSTSLKKNNKLTRFAMLCALSEDSVAANDYMADSVRGFILECIQRGVAVTIPPWTASEVNPENTCDVFKDLSVNGVVCIRPLPHQWATVQELFCKGFPVVITSRSQIGKDYPCVSADYFEAGRVAGNHFLARRCKRILSFHYLIRNAVPEQQQLARHCEWPAGIKEGLELFYMSPGEHDKSREVENIFLSSEGVSEAESIFQRLQSIDKSDGILFTHQNHLWHLLKEKGKAAAELLKPHPIVLLANRAFLQRLEGLVESLDISLLVEPYESIARYAVQKLNALNEGNMEDALTLVKVPFFEYDGRK